MSRSPAIHRKGVPIGKLILIHVCKPHTQPVTAVAVDQEGAILATGVSIYICIYHSDLVIFASCLIQSADCTVFFLDIKKSFSPIGYVKIPGPVSCMTWSKPNQVSN